MIIKLSPPTLSSLIVSSVEASSALFSSSVTNNGGDAVSEVGFYYSTEEAVDPETSYKINQPYSDAAFSLQTKELVANTKYYVKAFALNSTGESYSNTVNFKTVSTAPSVTTKGYSKITATSAELSGEVEDDNGEPISERGFVWLKGSGIPSTSDNRLQTSGETGEYSSVLENIVPNETYSFRAYATNSKGISYGEVMELEVVVGRCLDPLIMSEPML